ncbi:hypothetical protein [Streptomyces sp. SA15]|uniref:hypothetical protein n=1 Tax=Streptomyces sp. SA15 TaxID=934019 RepID=UPI0026D0C282
MADLFHPREGKPQVTWPRRWNRSANKTRLSGNIDACPAWNLGTPAFSHARYLTSRTEADHWAAAEMDEARRQMFRDPVDPVRDSGQYDLLDVPERGREVADGIRLVPAPGHTPGHPRQARRTRGRLLDALADTDTLLLGTHFPEPSAGVVRRENGGFRLRSEPGIRVPT